MKSPLFSPQRRLCLLRIQFCLMFILVSARLSGHAAASANLPGDWPTYGNGPSHTGYFPGTLNGLPFVFKWRAPMPNFNVTQPAVGGGRVFVATGWYFGAMSLRSLDAATGQSLWTNNLGNPYAINPPTYDDGAVYLQRGNDATSQLFKYSATNGATLWSTQFVAQGGNYMAPIVTNGTVYADTGYYVELTAYNRTNGSRRFTVPLIGVGCDEWTPAWAGTNVYTWVNGYFAEHNPSTGARNWVLTNATEGEFLYSMKRTVATSQGRAYFTSTTKLMAVDLALKQTLWQVNGAFSGTPAVANGKVYAISNGVVAAYTTNGAYVATYSGTNGSSFSDQIIVTDDVLIVAGSYGVYIFKLSDGTVQQYISSFRTPCYCYYSSRISLANNTLYVSSGDSGVYAYSAENVETFAVDSTGGAHGNPAPHPYGTNYVLLNSTITNTVTSPVSGGTGIRHVVTGWTGVGSVPASGTTNSVTFIVTNQSRLTWNWQTQYWLDTATVSSGTVDVSDSWRVSGETVTITATPAAYYRFVNWSGDASGTSTVAQVQMTAPRAVTANFTARLVTNNVPEWWLAQNGLPVSDAGALADTDGDGFANWKEYRAGTNPQNPLSLLAVTGTIASPTQFVVKWQSVAGKTYRVSSTTNLLAPFVPISTNFAAPPTNTLLRNISNSAANFYQVEVQ